MGVKQVYGDGAAQFLTAGNGVLHEEMWELSQNGGNADIELFQIWINLPRKDKFMDPSIQLVGDCDGGLGRGAIPEVNVLSSSAAGGEGKEKEGTTKEVKVRIIMGEAHGVKAKIDSWTPMNVLHVSMDAGSAWSFPLPATHNLFLYIKRGPLDVLTSPGAKKAEGNGGDVPPRFARIDTHETVFFKQGGDFLQVHSPAATGKGKEEGADFLLLSGEPLREPVTASGPFVLNDAEQVQMAYNRYQMGAFGVPWEHTMNDEEWQELCRRRGAGGGRE